MKPLSSTLLLTRLQGFLASVISASQSFGSALHALVTFDIVRVPHANPAAIRCPPPLFPAGIQL